jgi:hypothetical protein
MSSALCGVWLFGNVVVAADGWGTGWVVRWIARRGTAIGERRGETRADGGERSGSRRGVDDGESVYGIGGFDGVYNNRDSNSTTPRSLSLSLEPTILKKTTRSPRLLTQRTRTEPPSDRLTRDQRTAERSNEEEEEVKDENGRRYPGPYPLQTNHQTNQQKLSTLAIIHARSEHRQTSTTPFHSIGRATRHTKEKPTKHRFSTYTWKRWSY